MNRFLDFRLASSIFPSLAGRPGAGRHPRGQAMPYMVVMMLILVMCLAMMFNIAKLTTDRMIMQNAADNAAVSCAVYRARVLNTLGLMNYAIGTLLYGGKDPVTAYCWTYHEYAVTTGARGFPKGFAIPLFPMGGLNPRDLPGAYAADNQREIAGYLDIYSDMAGSNNHLQVQLIKTAVDSLSRAQDTLAHTVYPLNLRRLAFEIGKRQDICGNGNYAAADITHVMQGASLGLNTNKNGVIYHKSEKLDYLRSAAVKLAVNTLLALAGSPVDIKEVYRAARWSAGKSSWLYAEKNEFDRNHKIVVISLKKPDSDSNDGYPLFADWFDIEWPFITTIASAGSYNTAGAMFPCEESKTPSDRISAVLREYSKASGNGWDAHLIPVQQKGVIH